MFEIKQNRQIIIKKKNAEAGFKGKMLANAEEENLNNLKSFKIR